MSDDPFVSCDEDSSNDEIQQLLCQAYCHEAC